MRTIVRFRTARGDCALWVDRVTEVRSAAALTPLPAPRPGVAGLMARGDGSLSVLSILAEQGKHVIVIEDGGIAFGLLVDEVLGVHEVDEALVGPPPHGQDRGAVAGVLHAEGELVLLLDPSALRASLVP